MKPRSYLDHNATSPLRPEARAAMVAALDRFGNPSSVHAEGRAAREIVEDARERVAAIFGVEPFSVYFTCGGTEAANWLLQPRGDETLAHTAVEHPCVLSGHRFETANVRAVPVLKDGIVDLDALGASLSAGSIAAVQAANNETGVIQPIRRCRPHRSRQGRTHCLRRCAGGRAIAPLRSRRSRRAFLLRA